MIGNDVIDIRLAGLESNWQRKGYLDKVCTVQEQEFIFQSANPTVTFWKIWSMKEAVYKVVNRYTGIRNYTPLNYCCIILDSDIPVQHYTSPNYFPHTSAPGTPDQSYTEGMLVYQQQKFLIRTQTTAHLIHSVAVSSQSDFESLHQQFFDPSNDYLTVFNQLSPAYRLSKNAAGIPLVTHRVTDKKHPASVSHHGQYLAVIYSDSLLLTN